MLYHCLAFCRPMTALTPRPADTAAVKASWTRWDEDISEVLSTSHDVHDDIAQQHRTLNSIVQWKKKE